MAEPINWKTLKSSRQLIYPKIVHDEEIQHLLPYENATEKVTHTFCTFLFLFHTAQQLAPISKKSLTIMSSWYFDETKDNGIKSVTKEKSY